MLLDSAQGRVRKLQAMAAGERTRATAAEQEAARLQAALHQRAAAAATGEAVTVGLLAKLVARLAVQSVLAKSLPSPVGLARPSSQLADTSGMPEASPLPSTLGTIPPRGAQLSSLQQQQQKQQLPCLQTLEQQRLAEECAALRRQVLDMEAALAEAAAAAAGHGNQQQKIQARCCLTESS